MIYLLFMNLTIRLMYALSYVISNANGSNDWFASCIYYAVGSQQRCDLLF